MNETSASELKSGSVEHREKAQELGAIPLAVVTVSDTRTPETDVNGLYLHAQFEKAGHRVVA